jgi:hypothetical protein
MNDPDADRGIIRPSHRGNWARSTSLNGIHVKSIIEQLDSMGEPTRRDGEYIGFTYEHLSRLLKELEEHRQRDAKVAIWLKNNTVAPTPGTHPVDALLDLVVLCRDSVHAVWPVLINIYQSVVSRLNAAGIKLPM